MNTTLLGPDRVISVSFPQKPPGGTRISPTNRAAGDLTLRPPAEPRVVPNPAAAEPKAQPKSCRRRSLFRCVRLVLTAAVLGGAGTYVRHMVISAISDQAYINAEMTMLRAPIEGQLQLDSIRPGTVIFQGASLFSIRNPRFGNQEVNSQLNFLRELTERLRAEADEASVRCRQQEQVYRVHEKLHEEKLISHLEFIDEQTKLAMARAALTNKLVQASQAEARAHEAARQVDLQKEALVQMPFDGVAWTVPAKDGAQLAAHDPVLQVIDPRRIWVDAFFHERHANKLHPGALVSIRALDGKESWQGRVESIRAGVGRIAYENFTAALPGDGGSRRVAVRVAMESRNPYGASQFFGVGRSVVVSINDRE